MLRVFVSLTLLCLVPGIQNQSTPECMNPKGMQSGAIQDGDLVVSSEAKGREKEKARYGCCQEECGAAWCPQDNDTAPFYQVHFDTPTTVSTLSFQHPTSANIACHSFAKDFMQTFRLLFQPVIGTGELVEVDNNITAIHNESASYSIHFIPSFVTTTLRIEPQLYQNRACFKFEVSGCEPSALCPTNYCKNQGTCMGANMCDCGPGYFGATCELKEVDIKETTYILTFTKIEQHILHTTEFNLKMSGSVQLQETNGQQVLVLGQGGAGQVDTTGHSDLCLQDIDQCDAGFTYSLTLNFEKMTSSRIMLLSNGKDINTEKGVWLFYEKNVFTCYVGTSKKFWNLGVSQTLTVGTWYKLAISWNRALGLQILLDNKLIGSKVQSQPRPDYSYTSESLTIGSTFNYGVTYRVFELRLVPLVASEVLRANITDTTPPSLPTGENITRCKSPLGMESGAINSSQIVLSAAATGNIKNDVRYDGSQGVPAKFWCPHNSTGSFLEVHFNKSVAIGGIKFQLPEPSQNTSLSYMKTFRLMFKNDVVSHNSVDFTEFSKNVPSSSDKKGTTITLVPIIITTVIRFEPETWEGSPCFRLELLGCDPSALCEPGFCKNNGNCVAENFCQCPDGFYGNDCKLQRVTITTFSFLRIVDNMVITSSQNLTIHGDIKLDMGTSQLTLNNAAFFTMSRPGQCLTDLDKCVSGFTFSLTIHFLKLTTEKFYLMTSGGDQTDTKGIALFYHGSQLHCYVTSSTKRWVLSVPFILSISHWYRFHISWNPSLGLDLFERNTLLGSAYLPQTVHASTAGSVSVSVGNQLHMIHTLQMVVQEFQTVDQIYHEVQRSGATQAPLPSPLPVTTPSPPAPTTDGTPALMRGCESALGLGGGEISADNIQVSSSSPGHDTHKLRLDCCAGEDVGGWCADSNDTAPWVEIRFPKPTAVSSLVFQAPASPDNRPASSYVTTVDVYYNNLLSPSNQLQLYAKHVEAVTNGLNNTVKLVPEIVTDRVRVSITGSVGQSCMRLELIGCEQKDLCQTGSCSYGGSCAGLDACKCDENHFGNTCQYNKLDIPQFEFTILGKVKNTILTTYTNLTIHNTVLVETHVAETVLVLSNKGYVEIPQTNPCIQNLDECHSGFTYSIRINFRALSGEIPLLASGNGKTGLLLSYHNGTIHCSVGTGTSIWRVSGVHTLQVETWYRVDVSWSRAQGLHVYVDGTVVAGVVASTSSHNTLPGNHLCIGYGYTPLEELGSYQLWLSGVSIFYTTRLDLVRAGIMLSKEYQPTTSVTTETAASTPEPSECDTSMTDISFTSINGTQLLTSLSTMAVHGAATIEFAPEGTLLILDGQGQYVDMQTTGVACLDDITNCGSRFNFRLTFTFIKIDIEQNYILSSGGNMINSSGISLYYWNGTLNFWVKDGEEVYMSIYEVSLTTDTWYTLDASWDKSSGNTSIYLNGESLETKQRQHHPAPEPTEKHSLLMGKSPGGEHTSHLKLLLLKLWTDTVTGLAHKNCTQDLQLPIEEKSVSTLPATTATEEPITSTNLVFTTIQGNTLVTSSLNLTVSGSPQLTRLNNITFLKLNGTNQGLEIPQHNLPCLTSNSTCHSGFTFQIGILMQLMKMDEKTILLSNGNNTSSTMSLYYESKQLHLIVLRGRDKWELTIPYTINIKKLNMYQISWSVTEGLQLYENNVLLGVKQTPTKVSTFHTSTGNIQVGHTSATLLVTSIQTWTATRLVLANRGILDHPTIPATAESKSTRHTEMTNKLTDRPQTTLTSTKIPSTSHHLIHHEISFTQIIGEIIVTSEFNITKHGDIRLQHKEKETSLLITDTSQWLEIKAMKLGCISTPATCGNGFTLEITATLLNMTSSGRIYLLRSDANATGFFLYHEKSELHGQVVVNGRLFNVSTTFIIQEGHKHEYQLMWSHGEGLQLVVDNKLLVTTTTSSKVFNWPDAIVNIHFGEVVTATSVLLEIHGIKIWNERWEFSTMTPHVSTLPATTATEEPITSTNLVFTTIQGNTLVTSSLNLTVSGSPELIRHNNVSFLQLNGTNQGLEIPQHSLPCLTSNSTCHSGFTFQIGIMMQLMKMDEKTILLSNGNNTSSTMSLYYESKQLHLIVLRGRDKWELTIPYTINIKKLNMYQISWSVTEGLQLYENNVLLGVKQTPTKVSTFHTSTGNIQVGHTSATLLVTSIQTWTATRLVLANRGILDHPTIPATAESKSTRHTEMTNKLTDRPQTTSTSTKIPSTSHHLIHHEISFTQIIGEIIVTSEFNITKHGDIRLQHKEKETSLLITDTSQWLEIKAMKLGCISTPATCGNGFTLEITATLLNMTSSGRIYLLRSDANATGFFLYHEKSELHGQVVVNGRLFNVSTTFIIQEGHKHEYQLMWSQGEGLQLVVDNKLLVTTTTSSKVFNWPDAIVNIHFGEVVTATSVLLEIHGIKIWNERREFSTMTPHVSTLPATTATEEPITSTNLVFTTIQGNTLVTSSLNLTVSGSPELTRHNNITFLQLNGTNQGLEIPQHCLPCLTSNSTCHSGFTFQIGIMMQLMKMDEKTILLSNGNNTSSTMSLYYESKQLHLIVLRGRDKWELTIPYTINIKKLNMYQISWSVTEGLQLYENNVLLGVKQTPTKVSTFHTSTGNIQVGHTSATLLVTSIQTWTATRLVLANRGILDRPHSCHGTQVDSKNHIIDLSFKNMNNNILTTTDMNILAHGVPKILMAHNETLLDLSNQGQYLELETQCLPCFSDLLNCSSGFTIQIEVTLKNILGSKTYIIDNTLPGMGYTSLALYYENEHVKGNIIVGERKWMINIPLELQVNSTYLLQLSWSTSSGLQLYVDEYCVLTLPDGIKSPGAVQIPPLFLIGKATNSSHTSAMIISKLKIYLATRQKLVELGILQPPLTTIPTTTLTPPTPPAMPEFIWTFINIKTDILNSSYLTLSLHGQPKGDNNGIVLSTPKQYLEIPNLGKTCLTDIRLCKNGLTLAIELVFTRLQENTVILTTGAETPDLPGISVLYRYGHFHVIFSSTAEAWFVSIPREHISTGVRHTLMISWHQSLKVYVDQVLRATAQEHVSHVDTSHELKEQLYIGHSFTSLTSVRPVSCVLTTFHIWYKFIDELQKTGEVVIKEEGTTLKPDVCPAGCTPTTTTPKPTTATSTTTPKPTTRQTTESTTPEPTTVPDPGVPSFRPLLTLRPVVDRTGTYLACSVDSYSEKDVHIEFKWFINNVEQIAKSVNTPLTEGRLYVSEVRGVRDNLLNATIFCTAKAKFITGREWSSTKQSMKFVPHITMLTGTREKIILIEGHVGTTIDLKTNCPPSFFCKVKDKGECKVEVVVTLQTNNHDRKCTHETVLPQLVVQQSGSTPAVCGQVMTSSHWEQTITIPIKATVDGLQDKDQPRNLHVQLKVTGGVEKETFTQKIQQYQVLVKDKDVYRASTCSSLNDPHIATFDGLHYNNFQEGEYILYRHKTLPYEVRAQYRKCSTRHSRGPTCNCAVAVQSGDDVITISGCHSSSGGRSIFSRFIHHHSAPLTVEMYKNGELTPGTIIRRIGCGQTYEIRLPTGTTITVKTSFQSFINVWVRASAVDFQQSLGLCGSFNGNKGDDLYGLDQQTYRYTKQPDQFCKTWHVSAESTIFHGVSAQSVSTETYCSCVQGRQLYCAPRLDIFRCATTTTRDDVTATLVRQAKVPGPSHSRSKRAVTFDPEQPTFDQSDEIGPVSDYTLRSATQYCQQYMDNKTATSTCKQFVDVTQDLLSDCAEDLVQTGDEEWAQSHLDDIITQCVSEAVRTAPLTNATLAESVPHDVISSLCAQVCQHGVCQEASCVCDPGYTGISCDVSSVTKPEIVPVSEDGSGCNVKEGCSQVTIMGVNFVESDSLKCFYQLIDVRSQVETLGPWIPSPATYLSTYQVVCTLPPHSARVAVSNDGVQRSDNSYLHVVHNDCHTCTINEEGTGAYCHRKTDTCMISGTCYLSGEKMTGSECQTCQPPLSQETWTTSSEPLCSATKLSHTDGSDEKVSTLTILLAVFVAVFAVVIVIGVVVYCKKRSPARKKLVEEGEYNFSSPKSRLSSMPRPNMRDISFSHAVYDGGAQSLQAEMRERNEWEMRERDEVETRGTSEGKGTL